MEDKWTGKAVSIECDAKFGIFQGIIKDINAEQITIIRAFRNGVPLRKQDAEITLKSTDIMKINLIPSYNGQSTLTPAVVNKPTPVKLPNFNPNVLSSISGSGSNGESSNGSGSNGSTSNGDSSNGSSSNGSSSLVPLSNTSSNGFSSNGSSSNASSNASNGIREEQQDVEQQQPYYATKGNAMSIASKLANMKINSINGMNEIMGISDSLRSASANLQQQKDVLQMQVNFFNGGVVKSSPSTPHTNSVSQFFGNLIPSKVEARMGSAFSACSSSTTGAMSLNTTEIKKSSGGAFVSAGCSVSKPIDIVNSRGGSGRQGANSYSSSGNGNGNGSSSGNGNGRSRNVNNVASSGNGGGGGGGNNKTTRQQRKQIRRESSINSTFATSVDDPLLNEDFDFEGNLALFDKQAIWSNIEAGAQKKPKAVAKKYRHDENILGNEPPQLRGIEAIFDGSTDFVTDEGLIIPTVPHFVRSKIELTADRNGLTLQRQIDILARGATDLAIVMLGGARRLTPNNCHQWPKIIIICEKSQNYRTANIGAATGRHLASHGIKVVLYLEDEPSIEQKNNEIGLFKATGNAVVYSVIDLPTPDLVILVTNAVNLSIYVKNWLSDNRAAIFAIDPPPSGIRDVAIKYAILPILPLNGITTTNCGKLYLCNLGLPEKFYRDAGIKYKSPFGHKFVIPIHPKN